MTSTLPTGPRLENHGYRWQQEWYPQVSVRGIQWSIMALAQCFHWHQNVAPSGYRCWTF